MDVIFNCPKCEQELAVDSTGAGTESTVRRVAKAIVIPQPESVVNRPGVDQAPGRLALRSIRQRHRLFAAAKWRCTCACRSALRLPKA